MHIQRTLGIKEAGIAVALVVALALMSFSTAFAQTGTGGTGTSGTGTTDSGMTGGTGTSGTTDTTGTSGTTGTTDMSASTPGVPNTGVGGSAATTYALLALTGALAIGGSLYLSRMRNA